jgi:ribosomal protein S16
MQSLDASDEKIEGGDLYSAALSRWHADGAALFDEVRSLSNQAEPDNGQA